ncbi:hypothetical protein SAMN05428981_10390 [Bacillus sp. OV194]|nr:hypothetical protein SAMN05428981_10390 [Bacillus sp. OV194]
MILAGCTERKGAENFPTQENRLPSMSCIGEIRLAYIAAAALKHWSHQFVVKPLDGNLGGTTGKTHSSLLPGMGAFFLFTFPK